MDGAVLSVLAGSGVASLDVFMGGDKVLVENLTDDSLIVIDLPLFGFNSSMFETSQLETDKILKGRCHWQPGIQVCVCVGVCVRVCERESV